jgi:hypothetical protein
MLKTIRRAYSSAHNRDATAFFSENTVRYSIPIWFDNERKLFGNSLEIEFDLGALATGKFILKKEELRHGHQPCCEVPVPYYVKSYLVPEVKLLT